MAFALDQRAFGPRKLLVAFGERDGRFRGLAYTARIAPIDAAFEACLDYLGAGAATAVAFLDEAVSQGEPTKSQMKRFHRLEAMAARYGITLVDWISCDDELIRLARGGRCDPDDWWPQYEDV
jgi:hypothetical protein